MKWGLGLALVFNFGAGEVRKFERYAAEDIRSKLKGDQIKVDVNTRLNGLIGGPMGDIKEASIYASNFSTDELPLFTEPDRSKVGHVRLLKLILEDFQLRQLRIKKLEAEIPDCRYDYNLAVRAKKIRLSESGVGSGRVWITEKALEDFILAKFKEIKSVSVKCDRGWVWVEGFGEFLVIQTNFRVLAKLASPDGDTLRLTQARIAFDGLPADEFAADAVLQTLNPVVDLNKDLGLYGAIKVKGISSENGVLQAWGDTQIPVEPHRKRSAQQELFGLPAGVGGK
jgi:hypothetical protein